MRRRPKIHELVEDDEASKNSYLVKAHLSVVGSGPILMPGKSWFVTTVEKTASIQLLKNNDSNSHLFQQIPDEGGLACAVLPHQHHHWPDDQHFKTLNTPLN